MTGVMQRCVSIEQVRAALIRARERAEAHMIDADAAQIVWAEETITELVLAGAHPEVTNVTFTKPQEGRVGADWLWWWLDEAGQAFGMLVQAKRLHANWSIDFLYREGEQMRLLHESADALNVPDTFALYLGGRDFRVRMPRDSNAQMRLLAESGAAVSVVPGCVVRSLRTLPRASAIDVPRVLAYSLPLEDLLNPGFADPLRMPRQGELLPELRSFLTQPQDGVRIVARNLVDLVEQLHRGQFREASSRQVQLPTDAVFPVVPADPGHGSEPYMGSVLQGLRVEAPDYVQQAMEGGPTAVLDEFPNVAGMTVVRLRLGRDHEAL